MPGIYTASCGRMRGRMVGVRERAGGVWGRSGNDIVDRRGGLGWVVAGKMKDWAGDVAASERDVSSVGATGNVVVAAEAVEGDVGCSFSGDVGKEWLEAKREERGARKGRGSVRDGVVGSVASGGDGHESGELGREGIDRHVFTCAPDE